MSIYTGSFVPLPKFLYALRLLEANQFVDFQEASDGPELEASVAGGLYLPEALATAVQTAMNAASGVSATYTVSFSRVTEKYTIATDGAYFDILWSSGTNTASSCATAMGFSASADDTGATSYTADSILPNVFTSDEPIRSPEYKLIPERKIQRSSSGIRTANYRRLDREFSFSMQYIKEQNFNARWLKMYAESLARDGEVDYYPNAAASSYIRCYMDDKEFQPREMVRVGMPAYYEFSMSLLEKIPEGGTISFDDIFTRTA